MTQLKMVEKNILDHYTDLPVGEVLRRARQQYGLELDQVSMRLNIRPEHLQAIEDNDAARLPRRVYAIGFVRTYAEFLQLDVDKIVYLFKSQCIGNDTKRDLNFPVPVSENRHPALWMVGSSVLVLVAVIALLIFFSGHDDRQGTPLVPADISEAPPPRIPAPEPEQQAAVPPAMSSTLTLTARAPSWVEIRSADAPQTILFSRVLKKGESHSVRDISRPLISTGNAGAVDVTWNGDRIDAFEGRSGIVRDLPLRLPQPESAVAP